MTDLITLDELTERVGISVRNVRFYTTRGLLPPPIRRGRSGFYSPDHVARLELVKELQAHGFTLAAIEKYLGRIRKDATPEEIAVHRVTLQPWLVEGPRVVARELDRLAGLHVPDDIVEACREIYTRHGRAIAEELTEVFRTMLWPRYKHGDIPAEQMVTMLEAFQPASVAALVEEFSKAMTEVRRGHAARRTT